MLVGCLLEAELGDDGRRLRVVNRRWHEAVRLAPAVRQSNRQVNGAAWGSAIGTTSRRVLRAGRLFACWLFLELVCFPLLVLLRELVSIELDACVPLWIVFAPCWAALLVALRAAWTSFRLRRAIEEVIGVQRRARRRLLVRADAEALSDSRALNIVHVSVSLPLPLVHVSAVLGHFMEGCLLSLLPSLALAFLLCYSLLRRRCKCHAVFGMLASAHIIVEWCYFPACLLPLTVALPAWKMIFWLLPVTMPYVLMCCFAFEARAYRLAVVVVLVYVSVICLHSAFIGAGAPGAALSCLCLSAAGGLLSRHFWKLAGRDRSVGHEQVDAIFRWTAELLE